MPDRYPFLDVQGLAGAWTLGTVRTDRFELRGRTSLPGGFGDAAMEANRHLTGSGWNQQTGDEPTWDAHKDIAFACGTPPCSGFSVMNTSKGKNSRGPDSPINSCMRDLVRYASRCVGTDGEIGPEIVSFESVQGAYSSGRELMLVLRDILSERTWNEYSITHVLMSGASVGAAQLRHRYYPVFHRVPFGVERPEPRRVVTYREAIGDLVGLEITPEEQPGSGIMPGDWVFEESLLRNDGRVDWHVPGRPDSEKGVKLMRELADDWEPGTSMADAIRKRETPPPTLISSYPYTEENWKDPRGWHWPRRIDPDKPGYVITGQGGSAFVHWEELRYLTVRECSRLMGYPDDWRWPEVPRVQANNALIGKCCPVQSGAWLSTQVARSLDDPSLPHAEPSEDVGEREHLFQCTLDYRRWPVEVSGYEYRQEHPQSPVRS